MVSSSAERVRKHRETMRAKGLRLIQMWVPDTRAPGFEEAFRREVRLAAEADRRDPDMVSFLDGLLEDAFEGVEPAEIVESGGE